MKSLEFGQNDFCIKLETGHDGGPLHQDVKNINYSVPNPLGR